MKSDTLMCVTHQHCSVSTRQKLNSRYGNHRRQGKCTKHHELTSNKLFFDSNDVEVKWNRIKGQHTKRRRGYLGSQFSGWPPHLSGPDAFAPS